jgi:hypothetical protein
MIRYAVMYVLAHVKRSWVHVEVVEESALKLATTHSQKRQCVYKLYKLPINAYTVVGAEE